MQLPAYGRNDPYPGRIAAIRGATCIIAIKNDHLTELFRVCKMILNQSNISF